MAGRREGTGKWGSSDKDSWPSSSLRTKVCQRLSHNQFFLLSKPWKKEMGANKSTSPRLGQGWLLQTISHKIDELQNIFIVFSNELFLYHLIKVLRMCFGFTVKPKHRWPKRFPKLVRWGACCISDPLLFSRPVVSDSLSPILNCSTPGLPLTIS